MREGWEYKKLGEVCTIKAGYTPQKKELSDNGAYPYYKVADMNTLGNDVYLDITSSYKIDANKLFPKGAIVFPKNGAAVSTNKKRILKYDSIVDLNTGVAIFPKSINEKFAYYWFIDTDFKKYVRGGALPTLDIKSLKDKTFPSIDKSIQLAIVSELDKINELIRLKKEQLKDFDNLAQSIFYEMFGDPVENEKGWEVKKLGEVCCVGTGSTPNRKNKDFYENGIYPWVKSTEVCNLPIYSVEEYITQEALDKTNCTLYPQNTILMAMYGQGKTRGQIGLLKIEACTNQAVAAIVPTKEVVDENYICLHLMLMYEHIRNMARGGNQANLNLSIVKSIQIILPPLPLQHLFAHRIEQIEHQKTEVQKAIADLETLLASRMQYWFE